MTLRGWKFVITMSLAGLVACGDGAPPEEVRSTEVASPASVPTETLGGGVLTRVHDGQAGSPHVQVAWDVEGAEISITYGRPYLRDRAVGDSVEPMDGSVWRLGADEATTLVTSRDLMLGAAHVPAGEYSIWTITNGDTTELIVNNETGQWGTSYDGSHDLGRTEMHVGTLDVPADQFTLFIENSALRFEWGTMVASVPIMVH